jgi:selenocysteine-specific elongation factor
VLRTSGIDAVRARALVQMLLKEGKLVRIAADFVLAAAALNHVRELMAAKRGARFAVPEFKEWTGISRKYAIPLLEYLDRQRITKRIGEERIVL